MWYFKSPEVVFGEDALAHLQQLQGSRAFIVTDPTLAQLGVAARIESLLSNAGFATALYAEIEPEPSIQTVRRGAEAATAFAPDWIVGLGGGSPLDAAKAIWAMYERPDLDATEINPMINLNVSRSRLVAIPTTSGTGSEATWAVVLTDLEEQRKFSTGSREIIPSLAIIDPSLTQRLPPRITADTGLDALTHAIEGYTCTWRNDFTDGLCLKAIELVVTYLERAYCNGDTDGEAREKMGNAATLAGLGFGNANLGLAHAMGHSFGACFKKPHGRSVALFLPYVMEFSANGGSTRYGEIARFIGLTDSTAEEPGARLLIDRVRHMQSVVEQPTHIAALGISPADFEDSLERLCDYTESDTQFFTAPRVPDRHELERLFLCAFEGMTVTF